jgi:hypothetical protein
VRFAVAIGDQPLQIGRHPRAAAWLDFRRQNKRSALRCHRISVSGFTIVRT